MRVPVILSAHPDALGWAARIADGIEVKLDWEHAGALSAERTLADRCTEQGVDPETFTSVHLPPGTNRRHGMSIAPGNTGTIAEFTHSAFGPGVDPEWLTVHTIREFDYQEHVDRLATITDVAGYPLAIENTPDASHFHTPEEIAALAFIAEQVPRLSDVSVLIDTAHVDLTRRDFDIDEDARDAVIDRVDDSSGDQFASQFEVFLTQNKSAMLDDFEEAGADVPSHKDPWRPVLVTLALVGGEQVCALHLNDPETDGLPDLQRGTTDGLDTVLTYCWLHDIAIVIEPGLADREAITTAVSKLQDRLSRQ